ncbi:MAG: D-threonate 4-phosphate dehydrogenase [Candidatus Sumerlaeia bacterium]
MKPAARPRRRESPPTSSRPLLTLAVTVGDPAGIGPELIVRSRAMLERLAARVRILLVGRRCDLMAFFPNGVGQTVWPPLAAAPNASTGDWPDRPGLFSVEPCLSSDEQGRLLDWRPEPGRMHPNNGLLAFAAVREAAALARAGAIQALVTCPLNKAALHAAGVPFPGHTEMLAHFSSTQRVGMLFDGGGLKVALVTIHEPLRRALALLTVDRIAAMIRMTGQFMRFYGLSAPRLAVAGLNPHAGEGGLLGSEDEEVVRPAIEQARTGGWCVEGPVPPDVVFHQARRGRWDAVVALYHDQGLIAVKTLAFDRAVNITMGLPYIRTSPDHGTAYDIAGRGQADLRSFERAVRLALRLARKRRIGA